MVKRKLKHMIKKFKIKELRDKRPQFADFITLVHDKIDIEKYIAIMTNNSSAFVKKWAKFLT